MGKTYFDVGKDMREENLLPAVKVDAVDPSEETRPLVSYDGFLEFF